MYISKKVGYKTNLERLLMQTDFFNMNKREKKKDRSYDASTRQRKKITASNHAPRSLIWNFMSTSSSLPLLLLPPHHPIIPSPSLPPITQHASPLLPPIPPSLLSPPPPLPRPPSSLPPLLLHRSPTTPSRNIDVRHSSVPARPYGVREVCGE